MSKKYRVIIQRTFDSEFEIEAENEDDAIKKADEEFDNLSIIGMEMYAMNCECEEM